MSWDFRPGDEITAQRLNGNANARQGAGVRATGGITARQSSDGQLQIRHTFTGAFSGYASGTITARVGNTYGSGNVEWWVKDPSTGDYVDSGVALLCDNGSSTTGGIPNDTWVAGYFQDDGTPLIMTADCGN